MNQHLMSVRGQKIWLAYLCFSLVFVGQIAALWFEWYRIVVGAFIAATCILLIFCPRPRVSLGSRQKVIFFLVAVYLYMACSTLWSPITPDAVAEIMYVLVSTGPGLIFGYVAGRRFRVNEIASGLSLVPLLFAIQMLISYMLYGDSMLIADLSMRTILSGLVCLVFPILLSCYFSDKRLDMLALSLVCLVIVLMSGSRSLMLIAGPTALFLLYKHRPRVFLICLLATFFVAALFSVNFTDSALGRFSASNTNFDISEDVLLESNKTNEDRVDYERRLAAYVSLDLFLKNPIFGSGYSSTLQKNRELFSTELVAHGFLPGMLGEIGLFGFLLLGCFVWYVLKRLRFLSYGAPMYYRFFIRGFAVSFMALLAFGFFHQILESPYFSMLIGILLGTGWERFERTVW